MISDGLDNIYRDKLLECIIVRKQKLAADKTADTFLIDMQIKEYVDKLGGIECI